MWRPDRVGVTGGVGVRLTRGAPGGTGVPASALLDQRVSLSELWGPAASELAERLSGSPSPRRQTALLQDAIRTRRAGAALGYPPSRLARLMRLHRLLALARTRPLH